MIFLQLSYNPLNLVYKCKEDPTELNLERRLGVAKIIITDNQDLIKDGVQAIDDEFLEWFVKNPSCDKVEVVDDWNSPRIDAYEYKIIIPKEEPEQETLEEAAVINYKKLYEGEPLTQDVPIDAFKQGAKWQQERSYNEEEVLVLLQDIQSQVGIDYNDNFMFADKWFEQFKKK